ncbi:FxsA family protein [Mangrovicoccus algicola]|uniref:FxsA family protein n=1 Tax=Mangrovicoccus algicola TaxID=2771008 RepID=A0A8J7CV31_9RHOB|nr:FxsA family protein [Mangrovicoccus algicola]MBE3638264.1 FxsA family protein [Mangrovicoccus algicola]
MWLLIAFIAVPLIEIGLFIQVGGLIGLWPTLAIVLLTAVIGHAMMRKQGGQVLQKLQRAMAGDGNPAEHMVHGAMILFAGALLLTPGFFTDTVGFLLLIPAVRVAAFGWMRRNVKMQGVYVNMGGGMPPGAGPRRGPGRSDTIEGDFTEVDPDDLPPRPGSAPSGWTRR